MNTLLFLISFIKPESYKSLIKEKSLSWSGLLWLKLVIYYYFSSNKKVYVPDTNKSMQIWLFFFGCKKNNQSFVSLLKLPNTELPIAGWLWNVTEVYSVA